MQKEILKNPKLGVDLGNGLRKIRINIKSKGKGMSGGGRLITYEALVTINNTIITFVSIYNKGDFDTIDTAILKKNLGI